MGIWAASTLGAIGSKAAMDSHNLCAQASLLFEVIYLEGESRVTCQFFVQLFEEPPNYVSVGVAALFLTPISKEQISSCLH